MTAHWGISTVWRRPLVYWVVRSIFSPRLPRRCLTMPDTFDPYREALVMETETVWPEEYLGWPAVDRAAFAERLHATAAEAAHLEYVRSHTGFVRKIIVTPWDIERISS